MERQCFGSCYLINCIQYCLLLFGYCLCHQIDASKTNQAYKDLFSDRLVYYYVD